MSQLAIQTAQIASLQAEILRLEQGAPKPTGTKPRGTISCDDRDLLTSLAQPGRLVEWLADGPGSGADTLAVLAAQKVLGDDGVLVVVDRHRQFYPPEAVRLGVAADRLVLVRVDSLADQTWALDQALRCGDVAAVLGWPRRLDDRTFRRLQLAAEEGRTLGLLIRPAEARGEPSFADARLLVAPLPCPGSSRRLRIDVLRNRHGREHGRFLVEIDDETHRMSMVAR
jgi:hypothetical protein